MIWVRLILLMIVRSLIVKIDRFVLLKFIKHTQNLFNKWKQLSLLYFSLLFLLVIVVRCDHLHVLNAHLPSDTLDALRKTVILQNFIMIHFQLSDSFRNSIGLLVLDVFPPLVVDFHQLIPLTLHLFDFRYNAFSNMRNLIIFRHLIDFSFCLFSILYIHSKKFLFLASNRSKRIIKYLNFMYSLRILHNHHQTFSPERLSRCLTREFLGCSEALNHIELPQRHNMQFDMIIVPSEDTFFFISFASNCCQKVAFIGLYCLEPTDNVVIQGLFRVTQIFNNL